MEQVADRPEAAVIDKPFRRELKTFLFDSVYENRLICFVMRRPRFTTIGGAIQITQLLLLLVLMMNY